jgi:hypothetical protein
MSTAATTKIALDRRVLVMGRFYCVKRCSLLASRFSLLATLRRKSVDLVTIPRSEEPAARSYFGIADSQPAMSPGFTPFTNPPNAKVEG